MTELELHPLPPSAGFVLAAAGIVNPYVHAYKDDRWFLVANGIEMMLIEADGGFVLVDNPF